VASRSDTRRPDAGRDAGSQALAPVNRPANGITDAGLQAGAIPDCHLISPMHRSKAHPSASSCCSRGRHRAHSRFAEQCAQGGTTRHCSRRHADAGAQLRLQLLTSGYPRAQPGMPNGAASHSPCVEAIWRYSARTQHGSENRVCRSRFYTSIVDSSRFSS